MSKSYAWDGRVSGRWHSVACRACGQEIPKPAPEADWYCRCNNAMSTKGSILKTNDHVRVSCMIIKFDKPVTIDEQCDEGNFKLGDVVQLKSGGPPMTLDSGSNEHPDLVRCLSFTQQGDLIISEVRTTSLKRYRGELV